MIGLRGIVAGALAFAVVGCGGDADDDERTRSEGGESGLVGEVRAFDPPPRGDAAPGAPNVLVVMTDDQDYASVRRMPNVRRLLERRGTRFSRSYVSFPLCCPARATFFTGQFAHSNGSQGNDHQRYGGGYRNLKRPDAVLPVWLRALGYTSGHVGKFIHEFPGEEIAPGWDSWVGFIGSQTRYYDYVLNENGRRRAFAADDRSYVTSVLTRHALEFLHEEAPKPAPFFLSLAYSAPHKGRGRDDAGGTRCGGGAEGGRDAPQPGPGDEMAFAGEPLPRPPSFDEGDTSDKPPRIAHLKPLEADDVARIRTRYTCRLAALQPVDRAVARLVAALRELGELENTVIVFTSDNGYYHGEHRLPGDKNHPYEESVRVPLIIRGPGVPTGRTISDPVVNADLAPTILDLAGGAPPEPLRRPLDGRSVLPLIAGEERWQRRAILIEGRDPTRPVDGGAEVSSYQGVRTSRYLYVEHFLRSVSAAPEGRAVRIGDGDLIASELYDTRSDPYQLRSVHDDARYARTRAELVKALDEVRECEGARCFIRPRIPPPRGSRE